MAEVEDKTLSAHVMRLFEEASSDTTDESSSVRNRIRGVTHDARVTPPMELSDLVEHFQRSEVPEEGQTLDRYMDYLFSKVVPHSVGVGSPKFVGHMATSLPSFVFPINELMIALNQNVVKLETSGAFTLYEREALGMLHRLLYRRPPAFYDQHMHDVESSLGMVTSGGTLANIAALWCARNRAFPGSGQGGVGGIGFQAALQAEGVDGACIVASGLVHYSVRKAAGLLGFGRQNLHRVPVDRDGRMQPSELRRVLDEAVSRNQRVVAIVGLAGATETGSVDPLGEIADIARERGVYLHVDAAWGGPVAFSRQHAHLLDGIERADSITVDAHKQLYSPMGLGLVLFRDPSTASAIEQEADYIIRRGSWDLGRKTLEGSRPGMALFLHSGLCLMGRRGYESLIDAGIERARALSELVLANAAFELLAEPALNIVNYRYIPTTLRSRVAAAEPLTRSENERLNELNQKLQHEQSLRGEGFISRTRLLHTRHGADPGVLTLRSVLANPRTTIDDLGSVLAEQERIGDEIDVLT